MTRRSTKSVWYLGFLSAIILVVAWAAPSSSAPSTSDRTTKISRAKQEQVLLGRAMVVSHACGECHGGGGGSRGAFWVRGRRGPAPPPFPIGPFVPRAKKKTPHTPPRIRPLRPP